MVTKVLARRRRRPIFERLETRSLLAADILGSAASAAAGFDAFLEIDGIRGESADVSHKETIEIESFSWGATQTGAFRPNAAAAEDLHFVAPVSSASPALFQAAASGQHIKKAVLYVRKAGEGQQDYLKVTLKDVMVSSVQSRSVNESSPLEEVGLRFAGIEEAYRPTLENGNLGEATISTWDLKLDRSKEAGGPSLLDKLPAGAADQVEAVLQIAGIQGDSVDAKHKDWIDIESFSWGMSNSALIRGMSPGLLSMQDFHFVMPTGQASPQLLSSAASGKVIPEAMLTVHRGVAGQELEYLKYKLENILVSSFQTQSLDSSVPMDEVTLNFTKLTQLYTAQDAATAKPNEVKGVWSHRERFALYQLGDSVLDETKAPKGTVQVFLDANGIPGGSVDADHKDRIEIESFSWGMSRAINGRSLTGSGGAGKVSVQDFHFVARVNPSSPDLMLACARGEQLAKAVLFVRKSGGDASVDYLKYKLSDLLVSSYQIQSVDESLPLEEYTLRFKTLQESLAPTTPDKSPSDLVQSSWIVPTSAARSLGQSVLDDTTAAPRAVDMFLEIGGISGESADRDHKGEIEILSFSWGATQTGAFGAGGGGGAGGLSLEPFHVVTSVSQASPPLLSAVLSGKRLSDATLYIRDAGSADRLDYLKIKLSDVLISSYQTRSIDQSLPLDEVSLNFARLAPSFQLQDASGGVGQVPTDITVRARRDVFVPGDDLLDITSPPTETTATFIKFDGIDGEAVSGQIEVQSFSWGVSNPNAFRQGGGGGAGKVSMQDFHFVAAPNNASPELVLACATGKHFAKVEILARRTGGNPYILYKLSDALVSSYQIAGSSDDSPMEELTLNFTGLQQQYTGQDPTQPQSPVVEWNNAKQRATYQRGESILAATTAPAMDGQMFLTVAGIPGESADKDHKGWIEIDSFSWGLSQSITTRSTGGGGGAGKVSFQDFHFVADLSQASPEVLSAVARGKHFPDAILTVRKSAAEPLDYLKYELKDVMVSSYQTHGHSQSVPTDQFSLNYAKIKFSYSPQPVTSGAAADAFFATL